MGCGWIRPVKTCRARRAGASPPAKQDAAGGWPSTQGCSLRGATPSGSTEKGSPLRHSVPISIGLSLKINHDAGPTFLVTHT